MVYLCDFHREQAWERWLTKTDNGFTSCKEEVLSLVRRIARAPTQEKIQGAVMNLRQSKIWTSNPKSKKLRDWFENKWLREHKVSR